MMKTETTMYQVLLRLIDLFSSYFFRVFFFYLIVFQLFCFYFRNLSGSSGFFY